MLRLKPQEVHRPPPADNLHSFRARSPPETDPVVPQMRSDSDFYSVFSAFSVFPEQRVTAIFTSMPLFRRVSCQPLVGTSLFQGSLTRVQMSKAGPGLLLPPARAPRPPSEAQGGRTEAAACPAPGRFCPCPRFCTDTDPRWRSLWDLCPWVWRGRCPLAQAANPLSELLPPFHLTISETRRVWEVRA